MKIQQYSFLGPTNPSWYANKYVAMNQSHTFDYLNLPAQIHAVYPEFKALFYRDASRLWTTLSNTTEPGNVPTLMNWCLKDTSGNYIHAPSDATWLALDIGNTDFQQWYANYVANVLSTYGFDGVFMDDGFGARFWEIYYGFNTDPINPRKGTTEWLDSDIQSYLISFYQKIRNTIPANKPIYANGCYAGNRWFDAKAGFQNILNNSALDGFMGEGWWGNQFSGSTNIWDPELTPAPTWKQSVDAMIEIETLYPNKLFVPVCYSSIDGATNLPPDGSTFIQKARWGFASHLLAAQHDGYMLFCDEEANLQLLYTQLFSKNMGNPLGSYYMISGTHIYARNFDNGIAVVNPSTTSYSTGNLGKTYTDLDGVQNNTFTLAPHTGNLLMGAAVKNDITFSKGYQAGTTVNLTLTKTA